jgi:hypothetical protein
MLNELKLIEGVVIMYKLATSESPVNPNKLWRGKVMCSINGCVLIESLETGYEGLTEWIRIGEVYECQISERNPTNNDL